ncbi:MAG TPA: serine/threonine-protein kinase [Pseudonocardiaceae bacterium]|nr:serine/threonine-protein kinase [Pseudonocardiaceae bacterium]
MTEQDRLVAGRYRLGEKVGVGAMGVVWRARDERLRRTVAVKQLFIQPGLDDAQADEARRRAMREARIAARLQHPNVVVVYDVAEDDGQPWLIMEYVPSRSLATVLREGTMPPYLVAAIGAQAAAGLSAAHAVGVVHRDVKPGNVLLGDDGVVKIADFGISRAVDDVVLTATGLVTGTPAYLAPEMAKGETPEPPSDVFALGATLYAAVEGTPPFGLNENPLALLHTVAAGQVRPPANAGPLTGPLMRLLRPAPEDRPSMREAQEELAAVAAERTMQANVPVRDLLKEWTAPAVEPVPRPAPPRPVLVGGGAPPRTQVGVPVLPPPPAPQRPTTRKRRSGWLALVVVVALAAVGIAIFVVDRAGGHGTPPSANGTGSVTTSTTAPVGNGPPTLAAMTDLVTRFYGFLPGDTADAYPLLGPVYQAKHPLVEFRNFYATIRAVRPTNFEMVGQYAVRAVITFTTKRGVVTHEPYRFTIRPRNGRLVIDNAVAVHAGM